MAKHFRQASPNPAHDSRTAPYRVGGLYGYGRRSIALDAIAVTYEFLYVYDAQFGYGGPYTWRTCRMADNLRHKYEARHTIKSWSPEIARLTASIYDLACEMQSRYGKLMESRGLIACMKGAAMKRKALTL